MGGKAILLVTIGFGFILSYISLNISGMSTRAVENMSNYASTTESHNLAVTGVNVGLAKLYLDTSWVGSITQNFSSNDGEKSGPLRGSFTATMERLGGGTSRLRSVSEYPTSSGKALTDTVEIFFTDKKENSFTIFAWMTNFEGNVFWITGDTVWGRVHSNGNLHMNGSPVFYDKVTTAKRIDPKPGKGSNRAKFKNGYEMGIAEIDLPDDLSELIAAAGAGGRAYVGDIWVDLIGGTASNNDGYALVRSSSGGPVIDSVTFSDPGFNGVMLGSGEVHVQGTVDGQVSIASLNDIWVDDDVYYENRDVTTSDDVAGIIAEDYIYVTDNTANRSDCWIDGSIFSRSESFTAQNYGSGTPRGTLNVLGSIIQERRGAVGTFSGSGLRTGYYKAYRYDDRLADPNFRPPYFPGFWVKTYAITNWWENVRIPEYSY